MGRLIDADKLKAMFHEPECPCNLQTTILEIINEQPTAYDPDKVMEQLEKRRMDALRHFRENKGTAFGYASKWVYNAWNEAVEVVKGGVNESQT